MSKYDNLNPRTELEQIITEDLDSALKKRGFTVKHNGTVSSNAVGNRPDIEVFDDKYFICIEVTRRKKSLQDNEYQSIKAHLIQAKQKNPSKKCYTIFISPETYYRTFSSIRDSNRINKNKRDIKIIPICFDNFELLIKKLIENPKEKYAKQELLQLFSRTEEYIDDEAILKLLYNVLFFEDTLLRNEINNKEENKHQYTVQTLIADLKKLEDDLRKQGKATHTDAIKNVIYLVFMKLYEEKREYEKKTNRFSVLGFPEFQDNLDNNKTAVHELFEKIKQDNALKAAKMFNEHDLLAEKITDDFVMNNFIKPFEKYYFYTTKVDGLGAAYEVLGQLSGKDTKAGQFFTPENVVRFMVKIADLKYDDIILDPACGTGRFLIYAMYDMIFKISGGDKDGKEINIKKNQLYGTDFDSYVAKLSKMNMYIHGDGKTNIQDKDGLLLFDNDNSVNVILTNPPLGNTSYNLPSYSDDFKFKRMEVIPKRNLTQEKINKLNEKLTKESKENNKKKIEGKIIELKIKLETAPEIIASGSEIKGGALFINSAYHYLKDISNNEMPYEWKGGRLVIIIDEGLLNTDDYSDFRIFIKKHFFIKAIFSLTTDTFVPVSKTQTKTSILYLIKKDDSDVIQKEPILFAYIDKVGLNTKRKVCENHLFNETDKNVLNVFIEFRNNILACYSQDNFNIEKFKKLKDIDKILKINGNSYYYIREYKKIRDRIDENYNNPKFDEIDLIVKNTKIIPFGGDNGIIKNITSGKTPKGITYIPDDMPNGIPFLGASNILHGSICTKSAHKISEQYHNGILKSSKIKKGYLLISIAGTVGRCSIYNYDDDVNANQAVAIIELKENAEILPEYLERYLNSRIGQLYFNKFQHISSQPNINLEELKRIGIIKPDKNQEEIIKALKKIDEEIFLIGKKIEEKNTRSKEIFENLILLKN